MPMTMKNENQLTKLSFRREKVAKFFSSSFCDTFTRCSRVFFSLTLLTSSETL